MLKKIPTYKVYTLTEKCKINLTMFSFCAIYYIVLLVNCEIILHFGILIQFESSYSLNPRTV